MSNQKTLPQPGENKMGVMPVGRLLFTMALPMIISMLVQACYNVVDSLYVAKISPEAFNALSLAFPVQNLQIGFATGIGVGVNALLSKSLGEHDREKVDRTAGNGFFLMLACTVLFMLFGIFGSRPFFAIQSNVAETVDCGTTYVAICCLGTLGIFVEVLGEKLLQSCGRTVYTLFTQGIGAVVNIILDPILIFGWFGLPEMGIAGAAVATVIGQWVAGILALIFNFKCNPDVKLKLKNLLPKADVIKPILVVGIPSVIMMAIGSVMNFGMNRILSGFPALGEAPVGVFGAYFKLQSFFFMPVFGLNNAIISIVAYNYGARNPQRITATLKRGLISVCGIMLLGMTVFLAVPQVLLEMFSMEASSMEMGIQALRTISLAFPLAGVCIALGASFQALGNGIYSTITSLCRQLIVLLPAAYLLSLTGNVDAVWWSFPIAEIASLLATLFFFLRIYKQKIKPLFEAK